MEMTVEQMALDERKFLHDLSNHLVVAQGMVSIVHKSLQKEEAQVGEKELERLGKGVKAIDSMIELIKARRAVLHENS